MKKNLEHIGLNLNDFDENMVSYILDIASNETNKKIQARENIVLRGEKALSNVNKLLSSESKVIRWEAAKILQIIASKKSIPILIELLDDDELDIRWIAAEGLIKIGRICIVPLLQHLLKNSDSIFFRYGTHHVLNKLFNKKEKEKYKLLLHSLKKHYIAGDKSVTEANNYLKQYSAKK